jgi:5'-3' exonuclease|tara:strand:- start:1249 stop:2103 length:855 start_codon:yes stop_codon:yes gene_type:complete
MAITFSSLGNPIQNGNLLIVDSLNIAFRWKHQGVTDFKHDYVRTVESLAKSYNAGNIIIAADGGSSYRKDILPTYKANRKVKYAEQTPQEEKEFAMFMAEFSNTLTLLKEKYPVFQFKGVEADDIAAYISMNLDKYGLDECWMVSSDKDWDLLINDKVSRFSTVTRKETTIHNWDEHYDFEIPDYITFKCLCGDKGDNVPGIPGIGPKRAVQLMEQYGDVFDIYDACPIEGKYKFIQSLNENAEQLLMNVELMDLLTYSEQAIGEQNIEVINSTLKRHLNENRL